MDPLTAIMMTFGVILLVSSWILLLITSFRTDYSWGLVTLFLPPLSYLYGLFSLKHAKEPLILAGIGAVLVLSTL